ncbi:hypothetical protein F8M41_017098 [Gigaspora margarita]|uniref:Uncharacterized protein n=1 Tax=Gigaspora margarita TaxID=4874 RepID=A0A8H4ANG2_GIGMA|nr:hypothetical protein F8M41_017098 [Gigaspora margarita]
MSDPRKSDKLPDPQKVKNLAAGRDPSSAVATRALPKHDYTHEFTVEPSEVLDDEPKWQDQEHRVHADNDKKGVVGHLQKDWEESAAVGNQKNANSKK